jgi:2-succinyl-6-hydroxy-2,4-cyclohexadiene-1-carboxylate synthase
MHLHRTTQGDGDETVLVHGFTQTSASWTPVLDLVGPVGRQTTVDLPGHGWSGALRADLWQTAGLLADVAHGSPATFVGYSLGGRCCLHLALARPAVVERLVLVGATAGIEDGEERAARIARDEALAERIEQIGVEAFLDEWLAQPLFAGLTADTAGREERLVNTPEGLAASLRLCGAGTQEPLWDRLPDIACPVLLVAGEQDERFVAHAERMAQLLPDAAVAIIPGAGHAAHLEAPMAFVTAWRAWTQALVGR